MNNIRAATPRAIPWIMIIIALAVMALAIPLAAYAQSNTPDWKQAPTGLTVAAGDATGELDLTWDPHPQTTKTLQDYRVTWAPNGEDFRRPNSDTDWFAYPTTNQVTVTDLDAGETYKVRVRARYDDNKKSSWSNVVTGDAAEAPEEDKNQDDGSNAPRGPEPDEADDPPSIVPRSFHPTTPVAYAWSLRPSVLGEGDEFRLIFISSQKRNAISSSISTYNSWIQSQAGSGHTDIRTHRNSFRAVVCTEDDDARENTAMDHTTVVPVYWLGGTKVADTYNDFYDGSWDNDSDSKDKTEDGINDLDLSVPGNEPWTGCDDDGTEAFSSSNVSQALGKDPARLGRPGTAGDGNNPLSGNQVANRNTDHTMYGISAVFKIGAPRLAGRPTGLRATATSRSAIKLEWTAPTDTGDGEIADYRIEKSNDAGTTWSLLFDISSTHLTYTHTGLTQDTTRHYRVSARTVHGLGPYSSVANATTHSVPEPPTNLTATASGTERINLSWRAPSDRGSSAITGYRVEMSASGLGFYDGSWEEVVANTRSTSYSHTGLNPSTVYHYRVFAMNASGRGESSERDWAATGDGSHDRFISMSLMRAGVNGEQESDTSKIIQILGNNNTMNPGELNSINPFHWDHYPSTGTDQEKKRFLKDERVAIAIELDQNGSKIDKVITEITYHYPSYPVEGYVTVTYTDRGERSHDLDPGVPEDLRGYYGTCGTDPDTMTYGSRTNPMERYDYDSCPMLSYNGDTTIIVRAYSGSTPVQSVTTTITTAGWKER